MLRAYATADGRVLWETNTAQEFQTVNGVPGKGGSINGPGPVIAGGMLFTNSGYAYIGFGQPGNVLLAYRRNSAGLGTRAPGSGLSRLWALGLQALAEARPRAQAQSPKPRSYVRVSSTASAEIARA